MIARICVYPEVVADQQTDLLLPCDQTEHNAIHERGPRRSHPYSLLARFSSPGVPESDQAGWSVAGEHRPRRATSSPSVTLIQLGK